jgi:hypothetical protein
LSIQFTVIFLRELPVSIVTTSNSSPGASFGAQTPAKPSDVFEENPEPNGEL